MRGTTTGFVIASALACLLAHGGRAQADQVTPSARVINFINVYESGSGASDILGRLRPGESATLIDSQTRWYVIEWNGDQGFVYKSASEIVADPTPPPTPITGAPAAANEEAMKVHFIDVGQGSATLLEFPCAAALIDTGGESSSFDGPAALTAYLDSFFARRADLDKTISLVVLTHPHIDHTKGVDAVLAGGYKIENVVTNGQKLEGTGGSEQTRFIEWARQKAVPHRGVSHSDIEYDSGMTDPVIDPINCAGTDPVIRVLWGELQDNPGWSEKEFNDSNNSSVVLRVDYGSASLLVTGDLEEPAIELMLEEYADSNVLNTDIYLAGHHGSKNGTTADLVRAMSPKLAVFSAGPYERKGMWTARAYAHPNKVAVDFLSAADGGVTLLRANPASVRVGVKGAYYNNKTKKNVDSEWESCTISKALYSTGWDGNIVVTADADGGLSVDTLR